MRTRGQVGNDFLALCDQAGLTLEEAAARLEVSERTAYRYANGASKPSRLALRELRDAAAEYTAEPAPTSFRFIDLFAGIGGLRIGFEGIGGHCAFTSEWDTNSQKTYALNFRDNHPIGGDIREFDEKHLLTLEPGISENQTEEMRAKRLQLVVPKRLHDTYRAAQQTWLMDVASFLTIVRARQDA